ncbi:nucleotidyltransferase substrate-binding family protein [Desulfitobacterium hafniense DP7]|uniref:Nucleotidyltransferase substrate-binding family protein n=1 Tax=Desulfitobacterium hafniense DP7 TaxID=537010 RepID=G9XKY4_DESHA|nr:HI0074 family nucleotidyltransferase substrate-binding subunit [Desulfitobacterium hafniense]EHL07701.1 nucleotidyltransferase substrate-binding family protein [Desulfitobacterium hafniense DP7]
MERLIERIKIADLALSRLEEILLYENPSSVERDAAIQRFEFSFEAVWKVAKAYLYTVEGIDIGSPKGVIRSCRELGVFDDDSATQALVMTDDRNLTVHTYNEALAVEIHKRIKPHAVLIRLWLSELQRRTANAISEEK